MQQDPNAPISEQAGGLWLQRAVGVAALLVGLALGGLLVAGLSRQAAGSPAATGVWIFLGVIGALAAFFLSTGWRLMLNRPNRDGSLLPPALWFGIAALFVALAVVFVGMQLAQGRFAGVEGPLSALALAALAALAGRRGLSRRRPAR